MSRGIATFLNVKWTCKRDGINTGEGHDVILKLILTLRSFQEALRN